MVTPVDPNEIRLTGENSFIRLSQEQDGPLTTTVSHWRVLLSPGGPGHVIFLQSEVTDNQVRIYSDNVAMTRWLQGEIEGTINASFGDESTPIAEAAFSRHGNLGSFSMEKAISRDDEVSLTWYDFGDPIQIRSQPCSNANRPHGVYSVLIPARKAQLVINGRVSTGRPFPTDRAGHVSSTCCLAWSETWVRPR